MLSDFVREYAAGRTPIPCVHCNGDLKFASLVDRAAAFGADAVATGHYAQVDRDPDTGRFRLKRGVDRGKDQSYFLFTLSQDQLAHAQFPVGALDKPAVRDEARQKVFNSPLWYMFRRTPDSPRQAGSDAPTEEGKANASQR